MVQAKYLCALLLSATALSGGLGAQQPVPKAEQLLLGTWDLDLARSQFFQREAPRSQVMIFEPGEEGLMGTVIFTSQDGEENRVSYVASSDGLPATLYGSESFDTIATQNHGPYHATADFTHAGRVVAEAERRISMDGSEMTVVVERNGDLSSRAIFVKRE